MLPPGKGGLGRGLNALIPGGTPGLIEVELAEIRPNPRQPRHDPDPLALQELASSIREHGILQPLVVTRADSGDGYVLIAGERRLSAARLAGLSRVPVVLKEATPQQMLELALVENIQRADLNPLEEAQAYQQLIDEFGLSQDEVARRVGRARSSVANTVRLLGLPVEIQSVVARGEISEGHARALLPLGSPGAMEMGLREILQGHLSVRQTEEMVRRQREGRPRPPLAPLAQPVDPDTRHVEEMFRQALGTRVELVRTGQGGRLVVHFFSEEQLSQIYEALVGK